MISISTLPQSHGGAVARTCEIWQAAGVQLVDSEGRVARLKKKPLFEHVRLRAGHFFIQRWRALKSSKDKDYSVWVLGKLA